MAGEGKGGNPNVDVGSELPTETGGAVSFDDLDAVDYDSETGKTKGKRDAPGKKKSGPESSAKNPDPKDAKDAKGEKKEPKKAESDKEDPSAKPDLAKKDEKDDAAGQKKPKAKVHKFQHGEAGGEVSGEAVFSIPVNGVRENVALQDLVNEYNGKKFYENQHHTLTSEKRKFENERNELNQVVTDFSERAKKDPEDAWDFLAEMNGGDPLAFKEKLLRGQIEQIKPLAAMSPEQLESWINQKKLEWREKLVTKKEKNAGSQAATIAQRQARQEVQEKYGISDEDFQKHYAGVKDHLKGKEPEAIQIAYGIRLVAVHEAIRSAAPALVNNENYAKIVEELAHDMMQSPKMTQAAVETTLKQVFGGDDDASLRRASQNAKRNANYDSDDGARMAPKKTVRGFESFDDL